MRYFAFGLAPSMFPPSGGMRWRPLTPADAAPLIAGATIACNPSHAATLAALRARHGIEIAVPQKAPVVSLAPGDELIVFGVSGLPRLEGRHEYIDSEIDRARFDFSLWRVFDAAEASSIGDIVEHAARDYAEACHPMTTGSASPVAGEDALRAAVGRVESLFAALARSIGHAEGEASRGAGLRDISPDQMRGIMAVYGLPADVIEWLMPRIAEGIGATGKDGYGDHWLRG